jgi:tRNA threonylcarbamoyladenosine biosynthesis protein TsaB
MTVLGIETSTVVCSVGLANDAGQYAERSLVESHIHSEKLLTLIHDVCEDQKITLAQIDGIAVSIGPGSFTGLRIGLSTAKGISYACGKTLVAVSAFESIAEAVFAAHPQTSRIIISVDAKQGDYYFGGFEKKNGNRCEFLPVQIGSLAASLSVINEKTMIITDRIDEVKKFLDKSGVIENILSYCRGDVIARIAIEKLKAGAKNAPQNLEPMYLKDFIVRTHKEPDKLI